MKTILWTVRVTSAPSVERYCKRCAKASPFLSSGLFRVNAQKKSLDVWLIYKCARCGTTWNMTVLSRVHPGSVSPDCLEGFHASDPRLAMACALDTSLIRKNGGAPGLPGAYLKGEDISPNVPVQIHIACEYPTEIRLMAALRDKLGLSRSEMERMRDSGKLRCVSGQNFQKCKLNGQIVLEMR